MGGRQLIAEFLLSREDLWDSITFREDGDPIYPLHVCHAFADWCVETGRISPEQADSQKRILSAIAAGS